jgi:hypothetical protein
MQVEELKEKQPTEMIVISKSEYDLLRERNSFMNNGDEFELVDLILIPVKHWIIVLAIILLGIILGFYFGTSAGKVSSTSGILQSGRVIKITVDKEKDTKETILLLKPEIIESLFLSDQVINLMKKSLGAVSHSVGYNDKKQESSLLFYKDETSGSSSFANINLQVKSLNEKLGIVEYNLYGKIDRDNLSMLNVAFIAKIMNGQEQIFLNFNRRIRGYQNELLNFADPNNTLGSSIEAFKRKAFIENLLFRNAQFPNKPTVVLQKSSATASRSKAGFILPIFASIILSIITAFLLEFLQNSNFKEKLYNNLNNK